MFAEGACVITFSFVFLKVPYKNMCQKANKRLLKFADPSMIDNKRSEFIEFFQSLA